MKRLLWVAVMAICLVVLGGSALAATGVTPNTPAATGQVIFGSFNFSMNETTGLNNYTNMTLFLRTGNPSGSWLIGCSEGNQTPNDTAFGCLFNTSTKITPDQYIDVNFTMYNGSGTTFAADSVVLLTILNDTTPILTAQTPTNGGSQNDNQTMALSMKTLEYHDIITAFIDNTPYNMTANGTHTGFTRVVNNLPFGVKTFYYSGQDLAGGNQIRTTNQQYNLIALNSAPGQLPPTPTVGQAGVTPSTSTSGMFLLLAAVVFGIGIVFGWFK